MIALKNILVATDFSEPSSAALRYGMEFARTYGASLHVLHVVDDLAAHVTAVDLAIDTVELQTEIEAEARVMLASLVPEPDRSATRAVLQVVVSTTPARAILAYAHDARIGLIVIGTHGRHGLAHFFMGSVAQHVSRLAECPVLTVRAYERDFVVPAFSASASIESSVAQN